MKLYSSPIWKIIVGPGYSNCRYFFLIFIPHLFIALLEGGSFALIFLAFSALEGKTNPDLGALSFLDLGKWGFNFTAMQSFYFYLLSAIVFQSIRGLMSFLALYGTSLFSLKVQTEAQKQIYQQIFKFSFPFVSQYKTGDLSESVKAPSFFIPPLFEGINRFAVSFFMCVGLVSVLFWISPILTFWTLILFLLFAAFQKTLIKNVLRFSKQLTDHLFEFSHETVQTLQGIRPIHIFQRQNYILSKIEKILDLIAKSSRKAHFWNNTIPSINEIVNVLLVGAILILGSYLLATPESSGLPNLLTYVALTYRLATRMQIGFSGIGSMSLYYGSISKLNEILDDSGKEYDPASGREFHGWEKRIEFDAVSLQYPQTAKPSVKQVSFSIEKGTTTALVGLSGAGKSSILDLLLNLQKPTGGAIKVDSHPLTDFSHQSWRNKIGVVSQDTFVFNGTIEENIRFGDLDCTDQFIREAAASAGAADFIEQLPHGYQTVIGERGYKLSGGERQRIALARALVKHPDILVLDEFTSNLDSHSEKIIQHSIETMGKLKTILIVAHRLSTISKADQILVMEHGEIIERGTHADLIQEDGRYAKLWRLQSEKIS